MGLRAPQRGTTGHRFHHFIGAELRRVGGQKLGGRGGGSSCPGTPPPPAPQVQGGPTPKQSRPPPLSPPCVCVSPKVGKARGGRRERVAPPRGRSGGEVNGDRATEGGGSGLPLPPLLLLALLLDFFIECFRAAPPRLAVCPPLPPTLSCRFGVGDPQPRIDAALHVVLRLLQQQEMGGCYGRGGRG